MALISSFLQRAPRLTRSGVMAMIEKRAVSAASTSLLQKTAAVSQKSPLDNQVRHAGASALACGIATVALGGVAQGIGSVFAALVVGTARNPAIKDDLFAYTMIGFGMVELVMFIVIIMSVMLLISE